VDALVIFLFWIHLLSLALGGAAAFGIPVVGSRIGGAPAEQRPTLFWIADTLSNIGRVALAALIITGPLLLWLQHVEPTTWFWVKMVLVVLMLITVIWAGINAKRAEHGDMAAARRAPALGIMALSIYILIILSAVLAFGLPI
jgi:hypothetical protein